MAKYILSLAAQSRLKEIKAYSLKNFGKGQGVSAYTFIDERNLLWHSLVFSASKRENAYVVDGLMHNDVIKSIVTSIKNKTSLTLQQLFLWAYLHVVFSWRRRIAQSG